ncbi:phosphocholine-specific phospholipase C [Actinomadura decatromicini]|uniref:phospholipase C n=1 Tax=Actinomadura decatromicini TaxID=2604572 RepID=A0A5D3FWX9_9ACTN|nr:phospholipase C, phosphocholine-specific [Actinomadura decatromicini]TYK52654.1 phospholipase C, phosphocholine-specific [Actinomadura decatromicini]
MSEVSRRRFLQLAGGMTALSALPQSIARAVEIPAARRTGTLRDVEHIVVLMQENRSFDHYLGTLAGVRGLGDPRPVVRPDGKPIFHQPDGTADVLPFHPEVDDLGMRYLYGLPHGRNDGHQAFNNGKYDRWIAAKSKYTMAYLDRDDIPFHFALADAFTVCDAYHCSYLGATDPNRYYMLTGHTGNDGTGGGPVLGNEEKGYGWTTYPERLEKAGVSWKVYQDEGTGLDANGSWGWTDDAFIGNYGDNSLLYFDNYRNARPGDPLYEKARTGTKAAKGESYFAILEDDVKKGRLPQISWIPAPEAYSEHSNWPSNYGAWYIARVLDALTANPEVWSRTALIVTYDENDGFFDHVVPPYPPLPGTASASTAETATEYFPGGGGYVAGPYGLGPRVPTFVVSPWSKGGWVCSQTFDHTSILQFMERRFGVREPNISPWRRAVCGDLTSAFDFSHAQPRPAGLPGTDGYLPPDRDRHTTFYPAIPGTAQPLRQERGRRYTRPLPYALDIADTFAAGRVTLRFAAAGKAGACFYVTAAGQDPRTYTVEPGRVLTGTWTGDAYDISAHGPNGFHRRFAGRTDTPLTVEAHVENDWIRLALVNKSAKPVEFTVGDGYGDGHGARPKKIRVRPGGRANHRVPTARSSHWYDLTVTCDADAAFVRRLAGHLETGRPGLTDPAVKTR